VARDQVLTFEEIEQVARVCVERFGFDSIRLTGGEPTVRAHLPVLVAKLAALDVDLAMTTNGSVLATLAPALREAGLGRVNISLDSLRPERFAALTRRDDLAAVLAGIDAALSARLHPVKLNVVCMEGINDDEVVDFATFGRDRGVEVRFIEFMPLDADHSWSAGHVVPGERIIAAITAVYPLRALSRGSDPAEVFEYLDGGGRVGAIASVTAPFCTRCDRVRLTAEGRLRNCLFSMNETDLRPVLRGGGTDDDLAAAISRCVAAKGAGHQIGSVSFVQPPRTMSQIGG
jgi:cyclic pyranopterin phosphate synthase